MPGTEDLNQTLASLLDEIAQAMEDGDTVPSTTVSAFYDAVSQLQAQGLGNPSVSAMLSSLFGNLIGGRAITAEGLHVTSRGMRILATAIPLTEAEREDLVDTCGTGGDASGTFNISTAVALVAAAAGAHVAKHGNRKVTSTCGSADVLEALGIPIDHTPVAAAAILRDKGFVFLLATNLHPAMKAFAPLRRAITGKTIFNVLGPMTNPAGARRQVMGVFAPEMVPVVAQALAISGHMRHALIVHGTGGLDELSLSGESIVAEVKGTMVTQYTVTPEDAGLRRSDDPLTGSTAEVNATILRSIFAGEQGPRRDMVLLNAAAVLMVAGIASNLKDGVAKAAAAIDSGCVTRLVDDLGR
jgi:anthranilate phosphoribosyltransferase